MIADIVKGLREVKKYCDKSVSAESIKAIIDAVKYSQPIGSRMKREKPGIIKYSTINMNNDI